MLRPYQSSFSSQSRVQRSTGQRSELTKDRQSRRPLFDLLKHPFRDNGSIIVETDDERRDCVNVSFGETIQDSRVFTRLVEAFVYIRKIRGIERLHPDKDPSSPGRGDQIDKLFITQKVGADLRGPR